MKTLLLKNKNFRYFWLASNISVIGDFVDDIAFAQLVYVVTKSTLLTSYVFAIKILCSICGFFSATFVDRSNKKNIIILSSLCQGIVLLLLFIIYNTGKTNTIILLIFVTIQSIFSSFVSPARNAILASLVTEDEIVNARSSISIVSQMIQLTSYVFSGFLISVLGIKSAILLDSFTFFISVIIFMPMKLQIKKESSAGKPSFFQDVKEGFQFVFTNKAIYIIMIVTFLGNIFTSPVDSLMPAYFSQNYYDKSGYSIFMTAITLGSIIGSFFLTKFINKYSNCSLLSIGFLFGALGMILLFITKYFIPFLAGILIGISVGIVSIMNATILQIQTPEKMLGRTFSFFSCVTYIASPLGMILAGFIGEYMKMNHVFPIFGFLLTLTTWISIRNSFFINKSTLKEEK